MLFETYEQLKEQYAIGKLKPKEDEYLGENGLPFCKKCNTPRHWISDDMKAAAHCVCKCQQEEIRRKQEEEARQKRIDEFNNRSKLSLMGARYKNKRLEDAIITEHNRSAYEKCSNYAKNHKAVKANNIGLYIYGENSSGKTFLTACLCNELLWIGYRCIYTNLATILNEIRGSYDRNGIGEVEILDRLCYYDFAFIDDLGKEFIGREYNASSSKWAEEKLFEVLNARYNSQKPTIFSSNYSIAELETALGLDKAIIERINEMATRTIKLEGDDFREKVRKEKSDFAKKLGI